MFVFVSNVTILTFSKVTDQHLLGGPHGLSYTEGVAQMGDKAKRWAGDQKSENTMCIMEVKVFPISFES